MTEKEFHILNGVLERYNGRDSFVVIPESVTKIGSYAFSGCNSLEKLIIPEGGDGNTLGCIHGMQQSKGDNHP